jgi:hypothetical protein
MGVVKLSSTTTMIEMARTYLELVPGLVDTVAFGKMVLNLGNFCVRLGYQPQRCCLGEDQAFRDVGHLWRPRSDEEDAGREYLRDV